MAATGSTLLAAGFAMQGASSIGSAYAQSQAARAQGNYEKQVMDTNARLATLQADDAIRRGEKDAQISNSKTKQVIGSQRADLAGQGVDVNSGSAADIQEETAAIGALDALTIRNNAFREALGYKINAVDYSGRGQFAQIAARASARNTILTGGMNTASSALQGGYYLSTGKGAAAPANNPTPAKPGK